MKINIDLDKMKQLIHHFYKLNGVKIRFCSYDRSIRIGMEDDEENRSQFCHLLRLNDDMDERCMECDRNAYMRACEDKSVQIYQCHVGLTEVLVPIIWDHTEVGYFIMGKLLTGKPTEELWNRMKEQLQAYSGDMGALEKAFYQLHDMTSDKIQSAAYFMELCGQQLYLSEMVQVEKSKLVEGIKDYVDSHIAEELTISKLSQEFHFSSSYLSYLLKQEMKMNFTQYVHRKRIDKAKELLVLQTMSVGEVAQRCGFKNQNYFNKIFKRLEGCTPLKYKRF